MIDNAMSCDFETRSTVDLRRSGVYRYAEDPSTDIICLAWAIGDEEPSVWQPGDLVPRPIIRHVSAGRPLRAHNAQFERIIWRDILGPRYGFPVPSLEQWHDTAAEAAAMALPRSLGRLAEVLGVAHQKDDAGHRLMLRMCRPRRVDKDGTPHWWDEEDAEKKAQLIEYCRQDVRAERAAAKRLRRLSDYERLVYLLDQVINDRGLLIDVRLVEAMQRAVEVGSAELNRRISEATDGAVSRTSQVARLKAWLGDQGVEVDSLAKDKLRDLQQEDHAEDVEIALAARAEGAKASTAKLAAIERALCRDNRVRGLLMYHGASTGRWTGRLVQPHNYPRGEVKDAERYIPALLAGDYEALGASLLAVVSSILRGTIVPAPGHDLYVGDFSQVEARVLGWLAGQPFGDLEYERMAAAIYNVPVEAVTPDQRQVGKMTVLGAGYGMGWRKFGDQLYKQTGVRLDEGWSKRAIYTYRDAKARIPAFWYDVEGAAINAVRHPEEVFPVAEGRVRFIQRGTFLWCLLPSGRPLAYALPGIEPGERGPRLTFAGVQMPSRKWGRQDTYGGKLVENIVQAASRDLLADAMLRHEEAGYRPVLTVHDEVMGETPEGHGSLDEFLTIMRTPPAWAHDLALEAEGFVCDRYRK